MSAKKQQLKIYSPLLDEDFTLGLPSTDVDRLLELGDMMATGRPQFIIHLQKWEPDDDSA
jgi:hypothetical protein